MVDTPKSLNSPRPYVGPQPFERGQKNFYGRQREEADLFDLVTSHREVLLYAVSGAGKTSLLNAGLIPRLEKEGLRVLGPSRVSAPLPESISLSDVENPFLFNILRTLTKGESDCQELLSKSLADYFKADGPETVLIFDQLEEIFEVFPERWESRREFFEQISKLLRERPETRVLFSIRQDYLAHLLRFKEVLPDRLNTTYALKLLSEDAARLAIVEPLKNWEPPKVFAEGVADTLVQELLKVWVVDDGGNRMQVEGEFVEPVQLQVVCQRLWHELKNGIEKIDGVETVTEKHLEKIGSVTEALSDFYVDCLKKAQEASPQTKEHHLREFFGKDLITSAGTRAFVFGGQGQDEVKGIPHKAIDVFVDLHLIRKEQRAGADWYELAHDRFVEPIQDSNENWLKGHRGALDIKERLEEKAKAWIASRRRRRELLDGMAFSEAERWSNSQEAAEVGVVDTVRELIDQSRLELKRAEEARCREVEQRQGEAKAARQRRKLRFRTAVGAALGLLAVASLLVAIRQKYTSDSRALAAASLKVSDTDADRSIALALEAYDKRFFFQPPTDEAAEALQRAVLLYRTRVIIKEHGPIYGVAFSPDNKLLATAGSDKKIRLWDLSKRKLSLIMEGHGEEIYGLTFSPNGEHLATASFDGTAKLWDLHGNCLRTFFNDINPRDESGKRFEAFSVAFDRSGKLLAVTSFDGTVKVWDVDSSDQPLFRLENGHNGPVFGVAFSPDGKSIATSGGDLTAKVWDVASHKVRKTCNGHLGFVYSVSFNNTGDRLATSSLDQTAIIWDLSDPASPDATKKFTLRGHAGMLGVVTYSPYGHLLATASADGKAKIWDDTTGKELLTLTGHNSMVYGVAFSRDEKWVATSSWDGTARVWDISGGLTLFGHFGEIKALSYSGDGKLLATGSADGTLKIWGLKEGSVLVTSRPCARDGSIVSAVAFRTNNYDFAVGCLDGTLSLWSNADPDRTDGEPEWQARAAQEAGPVFRIAYNSDGRRMVTATAILAQVRDAGTGEVLRTFRHDNLVFGVAFSPDGQRVATASADSTARVWDISTGKELFRLGIEKDNASRKAHAGWVSSIAFSPNGQYLVTGSSSDRTVKVWDAVNGNYLFGMSGQNNAVSDVAFGVYKSRQLFRVKSIAAVATANSDGTATVWDISSGKLLVTLSGHKGIVNGVAFSPDGKHLASVGVDGSIHLNILDVDELRTMASLIYRIGEK